MHDVVVTYFFIDGSAIRGVLLFLSGMLLHEYSTHGSKPYFAWIGSLLLVAIPSRAVFSAGLALQNRCSCFPVRLSSSRAFPLFAVHEDIRIRSRFCFLDSSPIRLYLTHGIVEKLLKNFPLNEQKFADSSFFSIRLIVAGFYIAAIAGAAIASYYLIERPSQFWLRKKVWVGQS